MNHAEHLVDLVDKMGTVVGTKKRQQINKKADLYHTIFVILVTPDNNLVPSKIPTREDLPNLYAGSIGATVATIRRNNETPDEAGIRAMRYELFIENPKLIHMGDIYLTLPDGHKKYMSIYSCCHEVPEDFSHKDIEDLVIFDQADLKDAITNNRNQFALTFLAIWQKYQKDLFSM